MVAGTARRFDLDYDYDEVKTQNKRRLLSAFLLAGIAAPLGGWVFSLREPEYEGRPLSYWFKEYCHTSPPRGTVPKEVVAALQHLGSNAVPYLIEEAFNTDRGSTIKSNVDNFLNNLPRSWGLPQSLSVSAEERRFEAPFVLKIIKPPAHQVLSLMGSHLNSTNLIERNQSLFILGTVGDGAEEVVPSLEAALKDANSWSRIVALQSLRWIGPPAAAAVPSLIELLKQPADTNYVRSHAALTLGKIALHAEPAIPLIRPMYEQETNWNWKCGLAAALLRIDPSQTDALFFLTNTLTTHLPASDRGMVVWWLGEIGPNAKAAFPALFQALEGTNGTLVTQIAEALTKMDQNAETYLPRLKLLLQSKDESTRANAAARVLDVAPSDHEALLVLIELVKKRSIMQGFAMDTLGGLGAAAVEAVPALRETAEFNLQPKNREAARQAIKQIEAKP